MLKYNIINLIINNKYKIIQKIAAGGMADVFLGIDIKENKKVAIKILNERYFLNKSFIARFIKEAQILNQLKDKNIVSIYEWGQINELYFIVMEYISGKTLKEIIEAKGNLSIEITTLYAVQICNALAAAHNKGLIHRDIKPQNIIIDNDNNLKVTDFGIAKFTSEDATKTINVIGSAQYISPEHLQGKVLDARSDIYSLGIVLYEMLTGDLPFRGSSPIDISLKHLNENPQPPSLIIQKIPKNLDKIVLKCLEKDPKNRYQSVEELKKDLDNLLNKNFLELDFKKDYKKNTKKINFMKIPNQKSINYVIDNIISENQSKNQFNILNLKIKNSTVSDYNFYTKFKKVYNYLILALLFIFFISFTIFLTLFLNIKKDYENYKSLSQLVYVPNLINTEINSATQILSNINLNIKVAEEVFDKDIPKNFIVQQQPVYNSQVIKNSTIVVKISKGEQKDTTEIPNLVGLNFKDAKEKLFAFNLDIGDISEEYNDYFDKNIIISQYPKPSLEAKINSKINLTLSKGQELITIPDVKNYNYIDAKMNIEALGLKIITKKITNYNLPVGTVLAIEPFEGSNVEKNSIVTLYISTLEKLLQTPNLKGLDINKAIETLSELHLDYDISYVNVYYSVQKNTVIDQIPEPGFQIQFNEKIILFIGK